MLLATKTLKWAIIEWLVFLNVYSEYITATYLISATAFVHFKWNTWYTKNSFTKPTSSGNQNWNFPLSRFYRQEM